MSEGGSSHRWHFSHVCFAGAHETRREEDGKHTERCPVANALQSLVRVRYFGEVESGKEVPVDYVLDVELYGRHDNPEHVPG